MTSTTSRKRRFHSFGVCFVNNNVFQALFVAVVGIGISLIQLKMYMIGKRRGYEEGYKDGVEDTLSVDEK